MKHICIVDDSVDIVNILVQYISIKFKDVSLSKASSEEELKQIDFDKVDVLFLDCHITGGKEKTCELLKNFNGPIFLITGDYTITPPEDKKNVIVLNKPFNLKEVGEKLKETLGGEGN